jgi:hypothetical protein
VQVRQRREGHQQPGIHRPPASSALVVPATWMPGLCSRTAPAARRSRRSAPAVAGGGGIPGGGAPDRPRRPTRRAPAAGAARIVAVVTTCTASIRRNAGFSAIAAGPVACRQESQGPIARWQPCSWPTMSMAKPIARRKLPGFHLPPGVNPASGVSPSQPDTRRGVSAFLIIAWRVAAAVRPSTDNARTADITPARSPGSAHPAPLLPEQPGRGDSSIPPANHMSPRTAMSTDNTREVSRFGLKMRDRPGLRRAGRFGCGRGMG